MDRFARARRSLLWARAHVVELLLMSFGVFLRLAQYRTHAPQAGYDFVEHEATINWWAHHFAMPPLLLSRGSYHPQLYYILAGAIRRFGGGWKAVQGISVWCGCLRLGLVGFAAIRYMPTQRTARIVTLSLAAVMPAAVQLEGMVTQESPSNLLSVAFVVAVMELGRAPAKRLASHAVLLGLAAGLGLLTKISNLALLGVLLAAPILEIANPRGLTLSERLHRAQAWALAATVALCVSSAQYAYNHFEYGRAVLDGWYKRPTADTLKVGADRIEPLDRRSAGFYLGFSADIVHFPYTPSGVEPTPRLSSILIGSSFSDYYNYRFAPSADNGSLSAAGRPVGERATALARASVVGGVVISVVSALGWLVGFLKLIRRGEVARPVVLLLPAVGLIGQMSFATQFPYDFEGVVKGIYFQFAVAPLYAVFGASTASLLAVRTLRPVAAAIAASIIPVAAYTTYCVLW
jgi:hypothetical protein